MEYTSPLSTSLKLEKIQEIKNEIANVLEQNFIKLKNGNSFYQQNKLIYDRLMNEFRRGAEVDELKEKYLNDREEKTISEILTKDPLFILETYHFEKIDDLRGAKQTISFEELDKKLSEYFSELVHLFEGIESEYKMKSSSLMMEIRSALTSFNKESGLPIENTEKRRY